MTSNKDAVEKAINWAKKVRVSAQSDLAYMVAENQPDYFLEQYKDDVDAIEVIIQSLREYQSKQAPVDVEGLKKELPDLMLATYHENAGWNHCIDHLTTHYTLTPKGK